MKIKQLKNLTQHFSLFCFYLVACNCDDEASVCPWLKKMKDDLESMKENLNGTSGRWRKRNLERRIRYKTNDINKKQCYCDHKIKMCKAQEAGEEMPEKPGKLFFISNLPVKNNNVLFYHELIFFENNKI